MAKSESSVTHSDANSIVRDPWAFACNWYDVDDIHRCIKSKLNPAFGGTVDIPKDVTSRDFAEWLADQYRLAMRKGAELAVSEMRDQTMPIPLLKPFAFVDNNSTWSDGFSQHGIFELTGVEGVGTKDAFCIVRRIATARVDAPLHETRKMWLDGFGERIKRVDWSSFG